MGTGGESAYTYSGATGGTHRTLISLVRSGSRVLDVGCATGYLGEALIEERGCEVWGIDVDERSVAAARNRGYQQVAVADLDAPELPADLTRTLGLPERYDTILIADVLEHLVRPLPVLERLARALTPEGSLVVSLPNVGHVSTRLGLLAGRFDYQETGILDRTHVHLYTFKTGQTMLTDAGWTVTGVYAGSGAFGRLLNRKHLSMRRFRGLLAHGVILTAKRG